MQAIRTPNGNLKITSTNANDWPRVLHILRVTDFDSLPLADKFRGRKRGSVTLTADQATLLAFIIKRYAQLEHASTHAEHLYMVAATDITYTLRNGGPQTLGLYGGEQRWTP